MNLNSFGMKMIKGTVALGQLQARPNQLGRLVSALWPNTQKQGSSHGARAGGARPIPVMAGDEVAEGSTRNKLAT
jgi:hypothetical protein